MTTMTKKRVAELEGAQLDWAVGFADGRRVITWEGKQIPEPIDCAYPFSANWSIGGPIIERGLVSVHRYGTMWQAIATNSRGNPYTFNHPKALVAAMRAFVASKLGDEVEVPE